MTLKTVGWEQAFRLSRPRPARTALRLLPGGETLRTPRLSLAPRIRTQMAQPATRSVSGLVPDTRSDRAETALLAVVGGVSAGAVVTAFAGGAAFVETWHSFTQLVTAFIG